MGMIKDMITAAHHNSIKHGWHEEERTFGDYIALCHAELSEALEEFRKHKKYDETYYETDEQSNQKPCGIPSELADVIIRIFDFCGEYDIDLEKILIMKMHYNKTRTYKHGNKKI